MPGPRGGGPQGPAAHAYTPTVSQPGLEPSRDGVGLHDASGPAPRRALVAVELGVALAFLAAGLALGALWALVGSAVVAGTDPAERAAASDGTYGLLGVAFGLASAVLLAVLPGRSPVVRAGVALGGAVLGGFAALATGLVLGAAPLRADGLVLLWPIVLGGVTTLRLLVVHLLGRE